jgi:hypothetical protein
MKVELFGIEESNKNFLIRYWHSTKSFLLLFLALSTVLLVEDGWSWSMAIVAGSLLLLVVLYGLRMSVNVLYKVYLDDESDTIEIETLHFGSLRKLTHHRKDVKIKVIQDATSRYIADMIRIDVDRKTFFTQKQMGPWTRDKIEQVKSIAKQNAL